MRPASFAAPWDQALLVCTAVIGTALILVALLAPSWPAKVVVLAIIPLAWAWAPTGYRIDRDSIVISRPVGDVRIPLAGLRARRMTPRELSSSTRVWAVGFFFGYFGRFLNGVERQVWYVTDRRRCVRLDSPAGVFVLSPANPEAFLSSLEEVRDVLP